MLLLPCLTLAAEDLPGWLKDLTGVQLTAYDPKAGAVTLLNEESTIAEATGKLITTTRNAVKILASGGGEITFSEEYDTRSSKVRDFRAWVISPDGKVRRSRKAEIIDTACASDDVYDECRHRSVSCNRSNSVGSLFAYEAVVERQLFSPQFTFQFQDNVPVRLARFAVTVPPGWTAKSASFHGAPADAARSGGTFTWQMENLAPLEPEPYSPSIKSIAPWVGVNLSGPGVRQVSTWAEAARLMVELNTGQDEPNAAIAAKAKALIEGARTELDRIRAIGRFTQQLNYVSIQVNVAKGGGYRPHPATQVFEKLYGDCKDKANLTRAMLRAIGIASYPVAVYAGDPSYVTPEWPSLDVFNHAIVAIRVGPETQAPAVVEGPPSGRLLFFDPTNSYVPPGYLPDYLQASLALVGTAESSGLVRLPRAPTHGTRRREIKAALEDNGSISGSFVETVTGESFAESVRAWRENSRDQYARMVARWIGISIPGAASEGVEVTEQNGELTRKARFTADRFAQRPQAGMILFRAAVMREEAPRLTGSTRKYPVMMIGHALEETVQIRLPEGYRVDELPDPVHIASPFGKFDAKWDANNGSIELARTIDLEPKTVPASQYVDLRHFLDAAYGSSNVPVVLVKK